MELDPNLASLLRNLKLDGPRLPPKTWESIHTQSGASLPRDDARGSHGPIHETPVVSESILVRLVLNALQGVKSALLAVEKLSAAFCSSPADRTFHGVPDLWLRSSSTGSLGNILKSISRSGLVFFFLRKFVDYYLTPSMDVIGDGGGRSTCPPFTLVNQAFAVAVGKVLDGYICALDTLLASVKLRRSLKTADPKASCTSASHSDITVLEVYLHTKELRTHVEALGNLCFPKFPDVSSSVLYREDLSAETHIEFHNLPRGAELLTYLYVQLRDADPVHHELVKFLFVHSCEPYCGLIKSWIYHASIDDPYEEFFIVCSDYSSPSNDMASPHDNVSLAFVKEREHVSIPCFLKDVCCPLVRAGQQLQVLMKLLELCNNSYEGTSVTSNLANLGHNLSCWGGTLNDPLYSLLQLSFCREDLKALIHKRKTMYRNMLEKLHIFFAQLESIHWEMNRNVTATISQLLYNQRSLVTPFRVVSDGDMILSPAEYEGAIDVDQNAAEPSSTSNESSYEVDPFNLSECSSLSSSEESTPPDDISELPNVLSQPAEFLVSTLSPSFLGRRTQKNPSETELSHHSSHENPKERDPKTLLVDQHCDNVKLGCGHVHNLSGYTKCTGEGYQSGRCWPLGGILMNPFYANMKNSGLKQLDSVESGLQLSDGNMESVEAERTYFSEVFVPYSSDINPNRRPRLITGTDKTPSSLCMYRSWNTCDAFDLSKNPILAKCAWLPTTFSSRERNTFNNTGSFLSFFDFSSVIDPCKTYSESDASSCGDVSQVKAPFLTGTCVSKVQGRNTNRSDCLKNDMTSQTVVGSVCTFRKGSLLGEQKQNISGGANWEGGLRYSGEDVTLTANDTKQGLLVLFKIPLDIVIDKCILQEILLQYKYVSYFTIKLLEEGFDLREHLSVMQRYHFMELADWADSFVVLLRTHKWHATEPKERIAEIQGLLDLALQRSSCESDHYHYRLFVYTKEQIVAPLTVSANGLHAFDFIGLGYRVDWPVSIIVSPDALKIYAQIFSYLIQVRLAVFSLTDVWHFLKNLVHSTNRSQCMGSNDLKKLNILIKVRQQINHFVSTLQQYVHSHLSHVSWYRFQRSMKHQVKDMLDLESVHMSYLDDALRICFLSGEAKSLAIIIDNILQCALDFRSCFTGSILSGGSDGADLLNLFSWINFSQVFAIKAAFEKNLKDLYILYLKSPKHGDFGLCRFWSCLNFNDYHSNTISEGISFSYP